MYNQEVMCPERDELFARYYQLQQECDQLKHRLSMSSFLSPTSPIYQPPTLRKQTSSGYSTCSPSSPIGSSVFPHLYSIPPALDNYHSSSPTDQEALVDINCQIKATLTALLNCESVKSDTRVRSWIQERLMEAEHAMRRQRRRKSSADREERARIVGGLHSKSVY